MAAFVVACLPGFAEFNPRGIGRINAAKLLEMVKSGHFEFSEHGRNFKVQPVKGEKKVIATGDLEKMLAHGEISGFWRDSEGGWKFEEVAPGPVRSASGKVSRKRMGGLIRFTVVELPALDPTKGAGARP
jgi:hypothetical protein